MKRNDSGRMLLVLCLASVTSLGCPTRLGRPIETDGSVGGDSGGVGAGGLAGAAAAGAGGKAGFGGETAAGAGGASGPGGATGAGGSGGTGAGGVTTTGSGGGTGAGGAPPVCQANATECTSGDLQTCGSDGQWGAAAACTTGLVCERYGTAACLDSNWAEWPMPNSQVDVSAGAPNLESYKDNGDGTISDNVTGLMWQKAAYASQSLSSSQGLAYCPTLTLGGHSDWRLPSLIELISIVDYSQMNPAINTASGVVSSGTFLSSTVSGPGVTFAVAFADGSIFQSASGAGYALCVR